MAAGDIALRVLLTAETGTAISAMSFLGSSIKGIFGGIKNSLGMISYGFQAMGVAGVDSMELIKTGTSSLGIGLLQLSALLAAAATVAVVAIGTKSVKAAGDFQAGMTRLVTSAGELPQNLQMVSNGILQMAVDTATSTDQLSQGMYYIESSGYRAAAGLGVLRVAAMGAKSENADLMVVSQALTGVLTDYHMKASDATVAMNGLIATVQNGSTNLQDLSSSMAAVLPVASSLGIGFAQVAGSLDTMTNAKMSARQAAMNLGHVLLALSAPSNVAVKSMKAVGLSAQQVKDAMVHQGLPEALQLIEDHVGKEFPKGSVAYETALKNILGGIVGFKTAAMLTGDSLKQTQSNIDNITAAMGNSKDAVLGWDDVQKTFNFHLDQAKEAFNVLLIVIGTKLLPILGNLLGAVVPLITAFANWLASGHVVSDILQWMSDHAQVLIPIVAGLAAGILYMAITAIPPLLAGLTAWAVDAWAAAAGMLALTWPILLVVAGVAALVAIFIALYQHNAGFKAFIDGLVANLKQLWQVIVANVVPAFQQAAAWIQNTLIPALQQAATWVKNTFLAAWQTTVSWFQTSFLPAMRQVGAWFMTNIWPALVQIGQFLAATFVPVWQQLVSTWNNQLLPALKSVWSTIQTQLVPVFQAIWSNIQSQVLPILQQLWQTIQTQLVPVFKQVWQALQPVMPQLKQLAMIIGGVVLVVLVLLVGAIAGAISAFANFLSGLIQFVGGVVQFFSGLFQVIGGFLHLLTDLFTGNFGNLKNDLQTIWQGIQQMWTGLWTAIAGFTQMTIGTIIGFFKTFFSTVVGIFQNLYNTLVGHSIVPDMVNGIITWIGSLPGKAASLIGQMASNVVSKVASMASQALANVTSFAGQMGSKFASLASQAVAWGSNIIHQFLAGLQAAWGAVTSWVGNALAWINSHFPHSPVKMGPLVGSEKWGSNLVNNIVGGMRAGLPQIASAANAMALAAQGPFGSSFAVRGGSFALSGKTTIVVQPGQAAPVMLDKRQVGQILFDYQASELRKQGTVRNR